MRFLPDTKAYLVYNKKTKELRWTYSTSRLKALEILGTRDSEVVAWAEPDVYEHNKRTLHNLNYT